MRSKNLLHLLQTLGNTTTDLVIISMTNLFQITNYIPVATDDGTVLSVLDGIATVELNFDIVVPVDDCVYEGSADVS